MSDTLSRHSKEDKLLREEIGRRMKGVREGKGMEQVYMARLLRTTKGSLSSYESGKTQMPDIIKKVFAEKTNTTLDYLYGLTTVPYPVAERDNLIIQEALRDPFKAEIVKEMQKINDPQFLLAVSELIKVLGGVDKID